MKDIYPPSTIPAHCLVPPDLQPDYAPVTHALVTDWANAGHQLTDAHVAAGRGDLIAAIGLETDRTYTYKELAVQSTCLAAGLVRLGLRLGDRIAYRSTNSPELLIVMVAIWKAGGVVVPIPAQARPEELRHFLDDSGARALFVHGRAPLPADLAHETLPEWIFGFGSGSDDMGLPPWPILDAGTAAAQALPMVPADLVAILWHTGGTTGRPKGCYHTHRRFLLGGYMFGEATGTGPGQVLAAAAPLGHALGILHHTVFCLLHGATAVLMERYQDPETVLSAVERYRVTTLTCLMASWAKMADVLRERPERDVSSLRRCYAMWQSASASDTFDFWMGRGVQLLNNFGSTSFATWILVPRPGEPSPRASLGKPLPGYEVTAITPDRQDIVPVEPEAIGRMAVKGPTGLTYWNLPELQRRDVVEDWTLSDDLVQFDREGNAHYLGRTDFMISTGGFKVAPGEVEAVLSRHPAVREVAIVPAPCPIRQEIVAAFVALRDGAVGDDAMRTELQDMVRAELAAYKVPRLIEFVGALPRDPVGKVQTKIVKLWAADPAAR